MPPTAHAHRMEQTHLSTDEVSWGYQHSACECKPLKMLRVQRTQDSLRILLACSSHVLGFLSSWNLIFNVVLASNKTFLDIIVCSEVSQFQEHRCDMLCLIHDSSYGTKQNKNPNSDK